MPLHYYPFKDLRNPLDKDSNARELFFCFLDENLTRCESENDQKYEHFVSMELKINNVEVDLNIFFEKLYAYIINLINAEAIRLHQATMTEKLEYIKHKINSLAVKVEDIIVDADRIIDDTVNL